MTIRNNWDIHLAYDGEKWRQELSAFNATVAEAINVASEVDGVDLLTEVVFLRDGQEMRRYGRGEILAIQQGPRKFWDAILLELEWVLGQRPPLPEPKRPDDAKNLAHAVSPAIRAAMRLVEDIKNGHGAWGPEMLDALHAELSRSLKAAAGRMER